MKPFRSRLIDHKCILSIKYIYSIYFIVIHTRGNDMKETLNANYEKGVFRPLKPPHILA
ncbi:MAG: antitoxin family protein [Candidatus Marinimicrobia bacterium]|nr:antitoxin family protein [Candidatus Neomarinimicrobiota bacterium]